MNDSAYRKDNTEENKQETLKLKPEILNYIKRKKQVTMTDIYHDLQCGDIPMYLAIHDLVKEKKIEGDSPYEAKKGNHDLYTYTIPKSSDLKKIAHFIKNIASALKPTESGNLFNPESEKGFVKSKYWGTWNRLLGKLNNGSYVEINLTPINAGSKADAIWDPPQKREVEPIIIRTHRTEGNTIKKEIPKDIEDQMIKNIGPALTKRLLTEDFTSKIDWNLLHSSMRGGGIPLNSVLKKS